jgi:site-specific recombinase XerD
MQIEPLYEEFLTYLAVERNSAKLTVEAYRSDGRVFRGFLDEAGVACEVEAVTKLVLRQYVVWLRERGLQPATVARRVHSLRSFWNYLWDCEYTDTNPFRKLTLPKQSRKLPTYLSEDECRQPVGAAASQASPFLACRDGALLTFLLFTGARRGEVLDLTWRDVDLGQGTVRFVGAKGDKTRVLPLATETVAGLCEWRELRPACEHEHVFTTQWGRGWGDAGFGRRWSGLSAGRGSSGPASPRTSCGIPSRVC